MRVAIIGAGAVGTFFGGVFITGGLDVTFVARKNSKRLSFIEEKGVMIRRTNGELNCDAKVICDAKDAGHIDVVLLTVKSPDTLAAIKEHKALVSDDTVVISLQNGIGNVEAISDVVGADKVLAASTIMGAHFADDGVLNHVGDGETLLGEPVNIGLSERIKTIAETFSKAGLPIEVHPNINEVLYTKLAVNCAINTLTALLRLNNKWVKGLEPLREIASKTAFEVAEIAKAKGILLDGQKLVERIEMVSEQTGNNVSSMLSDVLNKRRTEISSINAQVVKIGQEFGIPTPVNFTLANLVSALDMSHEDRL